MNYSSDLDTGASAEQELRDVFRGKRECARRDVTIAIVIQGALGNIKAKTVDVSRTGLLVQLEPALVAGADSLLALSHHIDTYLGQAARLILLPHVERTIDLIRVTWGGLGGSVVPLVAFQFDKALSRRQYRRLMAS